jgi:hypothetical protein
MVISLKVNGTSKEAIGKSTGKVAPLLVTSLNGELPIEATLEKKEERKVDPTDTVHLRLAPMTSRMM